MKNIELTEEHKFKLSEMCKILFPEYEWHFSYLEREGNIKYWNDEMKNAKFIHWFEFCILHLLPKFNFEPDILLNSELKNIHIIDYLYEEFKEYEKN